MEDLRNIQDNYFNDDKTLLSFPDGRKIRLTGKLSELINDLINYKKINKIRCIYLFCRKHEKDYDKISKSNYNTIISKAFNKLDLPEDRKKVLIPSFIRSSVIRKMFDSGFSISVLKI